MVGAGGPDAVAQHQVAAHVRRRSEGVDGHDGPVRGERRRRAPAPRDDDHRARPQPLREDARGGGERLRLAARDALRGGRLRLLGGERDAGHRRDGLDGVGADGGLAGEHHGVRAVEDGVGDVARLGARRDGALDHRLQHLRRGDDGEARLKRVGDDALLEERHALRRHLDAEVAARDHHRVGRGEDLVEVLDGEGMLDLGADGAHAVDAPQVVAARLDVRRAADEAERDEVDAELGAEREVGAVLRRERVGAHAGVGQVHALVRREAPSGDDLRLDLGAADGGDAQPHHAVRDEDAVAGRDVLREARVRHGHALRRRGDVLRRYGDGGAGTELDAALGGDGAGAEARALDVLQERDVASELAADAADEGDDGADLVACGVGEVEADDVGAGGYRLAEPLGVGERGPPGRDDLGAAFGLRHTRIIRFGAALLPPSPLCLAEPRHLPPTRGETGLALTASPRIPSLPRRASASPPDAGERDSWG